MSAHERENEKAAGNLTPLIDIAFLILIFFLCLPFRTLDGKLEAHLPERGMKPLPERPAEELKIQVHILGRDEKLRDWGDGSRVPAPTRVRYRFANGDETDRLDDVLAHIRKMMRAASATDGLVARGEIKAGPRVPHKHIVAVLNRFAEARLSEVDFYGTKIPTARALVTKHLPYPDSR